MIGAVDIERRKDEKGCRFFLALSIISGIYWDNTERREGGWGANEWEERVKGIIKCSVCKSAKPKKKK